MIFLRAAIILTAAGLLWPSASCTSSRSGPPPSLTEIVPPQPPHGLGAVDGGFAGVTFAIIGDYGNDSNAEARVARLVRGWKPEFIITTGDNNYPLGLPFTIDRNIGRHYGSYIGG